MKRMLFPVLAATLLSATTVLHAQESLLISELLYQPRSGEAEYVELYNNSDSDADLADYHIVRWIGDSLGKHYELPSHRVAAHDYVVLTKDASSVTACYDVRYATKLVECALPPYPNDGGSVIVCTADSVVVDRLDYRPDMHSRLLRNKAGVALERRSASRASSERSNWFSASSVCGYGTPGYENSQSTEYLVEESAFNFSSTLVSPDADGYQDELTIEYRLDDGSLAAQIDVYDGRGQKVRSLMNNGLLGTHGTLVWDGRGDSGRQLAAGQYIVLVRLYALDGTHQTIRRALGLVNPR